MAITAEQARLHFAYDPETGVLTWKVPRARRMKAGDVAGTITHQGKREVVFYVQNQRRARSDNKRAGLLGAAFHKASGKFRARIGLPDGKQKHIGLFATAQEAHEAYVAAKRQYHSFCTI